MTPIERPRGSGRWAPQQDETVDQYRIRMLEERVEPLEDAVRSIERLRRDGTVAVLCVLIALALSSPQVWGMVLAWSAQAIAALKGAAS